MESSDHFSSVPVNAERYQSTLSDFLWSELNRIDVSDAYSQQDGATRYATRETIQFLRSKFRQGVISRNIDFNRPLRSLDFFSVGCFKKSSLR